LRGYIDSIVDNGRSNYSLGQRYQVNYGVLASKVTRRFHLGGDLVLFRTAITSRDRNQLLRYGEKCIDDLLPWHRNCDLPMTFVFACTRATRLEVGFEAALSATVVVAEESARNGIPGNIVQPVSGYGRIQLSFAENWAPGRGGDDY
jgi:hypothetical protein